MWVLTLFTMLMFVVIIVWLTITPEHIKKTSDKKGQVPDKSQASVDYASCPYDPAKGKNQTCGDVTHDYPGVELFFTFLLSNFVPTMLTPLIMVFGYIEA